MITTDLNGRNQVTLVTTNGPPIDIVVEPSLRMIYWSTLDHGILSASMDGADKKVLVDRGVEWATGLTIDHPAQRIYWADYRKGTIETILLNGNSRHIVTQFKNRSESLFMNSFLYDNFNMHFIHLSAMLPKRLQVFEDSLYITLYDQTIYRINKFGHNKGEVLVESFQRASDLFILHPLRQDTKSAYFFNYFFKSKFHSFVSINILSFLFNQIF